MPLFFELLQVALGNRAQLSNYPLDKDWALMFIESKRQGVVGVMLSGVELLSEKQRPKKELLLQWIGTTQVVESAFYLHLERTKELTRTVSEAGFENCVLKGVSVARYYPKHSIRQCGDINLWVDGDRKTVMQWLLSYNKTSHKVWHNVGVQFFEDVPVEIHFHPAWLYNSINNHRLQNWFENQIGIMMYNIDEGLGFACPSVVFDSVFSLVHTYRHFLVEGVGLRHIIDYYYILKALPDKDKLTVLNTIKLLGLLKFASAMMWVLKDVCGMEDEYLLCKPNEKEGRFLMDEMIRGGNFGHYRKDNNQSMLSPQWFLHIMN